MLIGEILLEEVFGKFAVVYHRTHNHENIAAIRQDGFQAGPRALYGRGIYATYTITSQFSPYMVEQYGNFIIKSRVNLDGFLILDPSVATKVYGKNASIAQQVATRFREGANSFSRYSFDEMQERIEDGTPSSIIAQEIVSRKLVTGMRGIVYFGRRDGRCVVCYEADMILPMSWTEVTLDDITAIRSQKMVGVAEREFAAGLKWERIANRALVAKAMAPSVDRDLVSNPNAIQKIANPTLEQQLTAVAADPTTIRFIRDPAPEVQVEATVSAMDTIDYIANPVPAAIIAPLLIRSDNRKLMDRLPAETVIAALRIDARILPGVSRANADSQPTPAQWDAAWRAPNANEIISYLLNLHPESKTIDAKTIPQDALQKVLHDHPSQLYLFHDVAPALVAAAVLSPHSEGLQPGYNMALGNCTSHSRPVDTSAIDPVKLAAIIQKYPNAIFAVADPSFDLVATAMKSSRSVARDLAQRYDLPPELKALAPKGLHIFN